MSGFIQPPLKIEISRILYSGEAGADRADAARGCDRSWGGHRRRVRSAGVRGAGVPLLEKLLAPEEERDDGKRGEDARDDGGRGEDVLRRRVMADGDGGRAGQSLMASPTRADDDGVAATRRAASAREGSLAEGRNVAERKMPSGEAASGRERRRLDRRRERSRRGDDW